MNETITLVEPSPNRVVRDRDGLHKRRGIWHYKLKIDGRWREFSTRTTNYREAGKIRQAALQAQEEGRLPTDLARARLEKVAPLWLEQRKKLVAHQTWRIDKERMKPLVSVLGQKRLGDISSDDVRQYQARRVGEVSSRTVNLETKVLRQILKGHKLWARIADDYKPLTENRRGPGRALMPEQEKLLLATAKSRPGWAPAFYAALLAANTTARACELKALRLQDVDLIESVIRIHRAGTKTESGGPRAGGLSTASQILGWQSA